MQCKSGSRKEAIIMKKSVSMDLLFLALFVDRCEWNGPAITSYEHCLNEHKECVAENNEFDCNVSLLRKCYCCIYCTVKKWAFL